MTIHTDVTTLSRLYPLFKEAGIEGVLSGDFDSIKDLTYPALVAAMLSCGKISEICAIITGSELYTRPEPDPAAIAQTLAWDQCSREECMGVIVPFLIDITVGPLDLSELAKQAKQVAQK